MATTQPPPLQKKTIFPYVASITSGIILCVLAFSLYDATLPTWFIFIFMGLYCTLILLFAMNFYQKKITKIEVTQQQQLSVLRHDVKGLLSPALLMADRILLNKLADEKTLQSAESIAQSIEKVADYLKETKK
ncbi:unnamed protein product [Commensalibacter communis]|uniref:Histidine kinase n=2 Tax=Commensalibacter communis TaxID=2972786 RepID=A0ABM9HI48_9PROT|nr:hypothetical protein [Commensalibacter communis]CAI3923771.1 unnamed protein product [Commensalibacter communis]CAI3924297.1 unnamed protein product [Commensalibacter communis]CAI3936478.1 unnamed protein product [Commensalibacter communis]CAI3946350.1 unnamed protein product [Commensalibacter communis]